MTQEGLDVVERHAVLYEPRRCGMADHRWREPADLVTRIVAEQRAAFTLPVIATVGWRAFLSHSRAASSAGTAQLDQIAHQLNTRRVLGHATPSEALNGLLVAAAT